MKKTFTRVIMALGILCSGAVVTSCDEDTITQIINIIGNLINTGQTYTYTGTATSLALDGSTTAQGWMGDYINGNKPNTYNMQVALKSGNTGEITIPAYTDGKVTVNGITISNLVLSASQDQSYTEISLDESGNSRIDGSITYNGVTYTTANLYIANAQATSAQIVLEMTIYFQGEEDGDDYSKAINFTYKGQTETAQ